MDDYLNNSNTDLLYKNGVKNKLVNDIRWELYDINKYINSVNYPENDLIFILGTSGEGKSIFATQYLLKFMNKNIEKKIRTKLWVFSGTSDAKNMCENCALILKKLHPKEFSNFNDTDSICQFAHTSNFEDICQDFRLLTNKSEDEVKNDQFIFYLDDVGTILSSQKKNDKEFFEKIASQGRHHNIVTIINSQKAQGLNKTLISQIGTSVVVGKVNTNEWEFLMKNSTFHSFDNKTIKLFYNKYFSEIGFKNSRNILIFYKKVHNKVFFQKVTGDYVKLVTRKHKTKISKTKPRI